MTDRDPPPSESESGSESQSLRDGWVCATCGRRWYYDRVACPECGGTDHGVERLGVGELLATTTVFVTPDGVREPNRLGLARFGGDAALIAQLDDDDPPEVGDPVGLEGDVPLRSNRDVEITGPRLVRREDEDRGDD